MVSKKGEKLKNIGCWCIYGERLEAVKVFIYLGVDLNLEISEEWRRQRKHEREIKTIMSQLTIRNMKQRQWDVLVMFRST